jgi:hypothetical protein
MKGSFITAFDFLHDPSLSDEPMLVVVVYW